MKGRLQQTAGVPVKVPTVTLGRLLDKYGFETVNLISPTGEGGEVEMVEEEPEKSSAAG